MYAYSYYMHVFGVSNTKHILSLALLFPVTGGFSSSQTYQLRNTLSPMKKHKKDQ